MVYGGSKIDTYFDRDLEREFFAGDLDLLRLPRDLDRLRDFERLRDDLKIVFCLLHLGRG